MLARYACSGKWSVVAVTGLALLAGSGVFAASRPGMRKVGDELVVAGPVFKACRLIDVGGLKFYACKLDKNNADCTVVTGWIESHAPHNRYVVTLDIDFYEVHANACQAGTARIEIDRPMPGQKVRFKGLGPAWFAPYARGESKKAVTAWYEVRTHIRLYKPPKFDPPR